MVGYIITFIAGMIVGVFMMCLVYIGRDDRE